jgi:hypothetical protein
MAVPIQAAALLKRQLDENQPKLAAMIPALVVMVKNTRNAAAKAPNTF